MNQPIIQEPGGEAFSGGGQIERYVPPEPFCVVFIKRSFPILSSQFERVGVTNWTLNLSSFVDEGTRRLKSAHCASTERTVRIHSFIIVSSSRSERSSISITCTFCALGEIIHRKWFRMASISVLDFTQKYASADIFISLSHTHTRTKHALHSAGSLDCARFVRERKPRANSRKRTE